VWRFGKLSDHVEQLDHYSPGDLGTLLGSGLTAFVTARTDRRRNEALERQQIRDEAAIALNAANCGPSIRSGAETAGRPPTRA
jgi:hypothetical protein